MLSSFTGNRFSSRSESRHPVRRSRPHGHPSPKRSKMLAHRFKGGYIIPYAAPEKQNPHCVINIPGAALHQDQINGFITSHNAPGMVEIVDS